MSGWETYRSNVAARTVRAIRASAPMQIESSEHRIIPVDRGDYIVIDGTGWPYPVKAPLFDQTYSKDTNNGR